MADRILIWHEPNAIGTDGRIGPTYYMEENYAPVAVRIHAENAPSDRSCTVKIFDDGVSIFKNHAATHISATGIYTYDTSSPTALLPKGQNTDDDNEEFATKRILKGSWVHCTVPDTGGAKNITVTLELDKSA